MLKDESHEALENRFRTFFLNSTYVALYSFIVENEFIWFLMRNVQRKFLVSMYRNLFYFSHITSKRYRRLILN